MGVLKQVRPGRLVVLGIALMAVLVLAWGQAAPRSARAEDTGPRMALNVTGEDASCDALSEPTECSLDFGSPFTLSVEVLEAPPEGYITLQTFINYGRDLVYEPAVTAEVEIVWPDLAGFALTDQEGTGLVNHGASTAFIPPFPVSTFLGTVVELSMKCSAAYSQTEIELIPYNVSLAGTSGAVFVLPDATEVPAKGDSVTVTCGVPPTPGEPVEGETPGATATTGAELPPTGDGGASDAGGGIGAGLWVVIGALLAAAAAGLAVFGWRYMRVR